MATPPIDDGSSLARFFEWVGSAVGGAFVALVAFRTRLALNDKRMDGHDARVLELQRRFDLIDRRQIVTLEILADIANKLGIDGRFSDLVMKFLADDREGR
jgi:hypothetical protein